MKVGVNKFPLRGDVYWVSLDPTIGTEIKKTRPALIVSNDIGNENSNRVIVAPITSKIGKIYPFQVQIILKDKEGKVLLDQIRTVDKTRLGRKEGSVNVDTMGEIDQALKFVLSLY